MDWCFAKVNNKLAEIYFEKKRGKIKFLGHVYVQKKEYKTKNELRWIEEDIKKIKLLYKNKKYIELS